jgi:hypothetical protein
MGYFPLEHSAHGLSPGAVAGLPLIAERRIIVLYVVLMAAVIVVIDVLFFKNRLWERLAVNAGIVLIFGAFYFRFLKRP